MTIPVVLYGTQSNGETLPVQVDATGRLVAEGLEGPPGPPGPDGEPGEDGADLQLPPDPYEGAFLCWLNGELAWYGTPPIVIPEGVFGPMLTVAEDGLVTVDGTIPETIGTGVYLTQCDFQGNPTRPEKQWITSKDWSSLPNNLLGGEAAPVMAFDGNEATAATYGHNWEITGFNLENVTTVELYLTYNISGRDLTVSASVNNGQIQSKTGFNSQIILSPVRFHIQGTLESIQLIVVDAQTVGLARVVVDGRTLVDSELGALKVRVTNRLSDTQLLVAPPSDGILHPGQYLKTDIQRVAPWVLYGNDPTSLIDHLRRTRD